jgi:uncharacterized protein YkwD
VTSGSLTDASASCTGPDPPTDPEDLALRSPRLFTLVLAPLLALPGAFVLAPSAAYADATSTMISKTNNSRSSNGLSGYSVASDLSSIAQSHAEAMARNHDDYHNSSLTTDVCCWQSVGENVGKGPDASAIHNAFMNSSEHRSNILSSTFTQVGIGTAHDSNGLLYVDEVFRKPSGSGGGGSGSGGGGDGSGTHHHHSGGGSGDGGSGGSGSGGTQPAPAPVQALVRTTTAASRSTVRVPLVVVLPDLMTLIRRALWTAAARHSHTRSPVASALGFATVVSRALRH